MTNLFYLIYGAVQGLTEFLPISSSGHLVIAQTIIGLNLKGIALEVTLHVATLIAVLIFLRKRILGILKDAFSEGRKRRLAWRVILAVVVATVPSALVGVSLGGFLERTFENIQIVGICLLITSAMVLTIPFLPKKEGTIEEFPWLGVVLVGTFQAMAILPGISRAGATIFIGVLMGLNRREAANFSFIISIPAIIGAALLQLPELTTGERAPAVGLVIGAASALLFGLLALAVLYKTVHRGGFALFGLYALVVAILVLAGFFLWLNGQLHTAFPDTFPISV